MIFLLHCLLDADGHQRSYFHLLELKENYQGELSHCEEGEKEGEEDQQTSASGESSTTAEEGESGDEEADAKDEVASQW